MLFSVLLQISSDQHRPERKASVHGPNLHQVLHRRRVRGGIEARRSNRVERPSRGRHRQRHHLQRTLHRRRLQCRKWKSCTFPNFEALLRFLFIFQSLVLCINLFKEYCVMRLSIYSLFNFRSQWAKIQIQFFIIHKTLTNTSILENYGKCKTSCARKHLQSTLDSFGVFNLFLIHLKSIS